MSCKNSSFYQRPTEAVAKDLVGKKLVRIIRNNKKQFRLAGIIVETEAYGYSGDDLASHACVGPTGRNKIMFGNVGRAYVYFTYGNPATTDIYTLSLHVAVGQVP